MNEHTALRKILEAAIHAPSADNTQPWKVTVEGDSIDLFHLPERDISPYDTGQRGSLLAHGAFIENATIAAAAMNGSLSVSLDDPGPSNGWHVAHMVFLSKKDTKAPEHLYPQISKRITNRKPYKAEKLSSDHKNELIHCSDMGTKRIKILDCPQPALARAASLTEQISFQNKYVHENLFKHIRWSQHEVQATRDGFSIETFELPLPATVMFKVARNWRRLDFLNKTLGLAQTLPKQVSQLYEQSAAFIGILGTAHSAADWIEVGRVMERVWLTSTSLGISMQPIGAILFFKQSLDHKTTSVFNSEDKKLIEAASSGIQEAFRPESGEQVLFTLRAGLAEAPSERTIRYRLSDVLTTS